MCGAGVEERRQSSESRVGTGRQKLHRAGRARGKAAHPRARSSIEVDARSACQPLPRSGARCPRSCPQGQFRCGGAGTLGDTVAVTKRARIDPGVLHHRAQVGVLSGLARGDDVYDLGRSGSQPRAGPVLAGRRPARVRRRGARSCLSSRRRAARVRGTVRALLPARGDVPRTRGAPQQPVRPLRRGLHAGPGLPSDAGWWQTPLCQYAVFAVVIYSRAAAERLGVPLEEIARPIAAWHHLDVPKDGGPL